MKKNNIFKENLIKISISIIAIFVLCFMFFKVFRNISLKDNVATAVTKFNSDGTIAYTELTDADTSTNCQYVKFSAYYLKDNNNDGYAEKYNGTCLSIGGTDTLYMDVNVLSNGKLKNGKITINGKNFYLKSSIVKDSIIANDYISENLKSIELNEIKSGTQKLIFSFVRSGVYSQYGDISAAIGNNKNNYSVNDNSITFTGTHVDDEGNETEVSKTVYLKNDWYGRTQANFDYDYNKQTHDLDVGVNKDENTFDVEFEIKTTESAKELILSNHHLEGVIPEINGLAPISVELEEGIGDFNYDENTRTFSIDKNAKVEENGNVVNQLPRSSIYKIKIKYPLDIYSETQKDTISVVIPTKCTYSGFNNENYDNPYVSGETETSISIIYTNPNGDYGINLGVGQYLRELRKNVISKEQPLKIYNKNDLTNVDNDTYSVRWGFNANKIEGHTFMLKESSEHDADELIDGSANSTSMNDYISNIGVCFYGSFKNLLGQDGEIKLYDDDTNVLLHKFTIKELSTYNSSDNSYYYFESPVKHVRAEISEIVDSGNFTIYFKKKIDDTKLTTDFSKEEFDKFQHIYTYLDGYLGTVGEDGTSQFVKTLFTLADAKYVEPYTYAEININPSYITNQSTVKNVILNIKGNSNDYAHNEWKDGILLIKYPEQIIDVEINRIIPNSNKININSVETYTEDGSIFTKIYVTNDGADAIEFKIDTNISADPRQYSTATDVELYFYNSESNNYMNEHQSKDIFDINNNQNIVENVGYNRTSLSIIAPSNLLTSQTITDYDDNGSIAIAPQIAEVNKSDETRTAIINPGVTNNYSNTVSQVKILGTIPCQGNKYILSKKDLNSTYTTTMTNKGIIVPENLKNYVTVYYSYNIDVNQDSTDSSNGWTTTPDDWSKVRSYLIDFGGYAIPTNETDTFSYEVVIPAGLNYNQIAYADHAVYYYLDTDQGKLLTQTEPNKVGISITEKYNLQIKKYTKNSNETFSGAVFKVKEVNDDIDESELEEKTATSDNTGLAVIKNLYIGKTYEISELRTDANHILSTEKQKIVANIVNDKIEVTVLEGTFRENPTVEKIDNANSVVKVGLENETKFNFSLLKTDLNSDKPIEGIVFKLEGSDGSIKNMSTDSNGLISTSQLILGQKYTLTETEKNGHYAINPVSFIVNRSENGDFKVDVTEGSFAETPNVVIGKDAVPTVNLKLQNEKIPSYTLQITKKEENSENVLKGTQFTLSGDNQIGTKIYETDENGILTFNNLYKYSANHQEITGEYTLTEIYASSGYILSGSPIKFRLEDDDNGELKFNLLSGKIRENADEVEIDSSDSNNVIVKITIDNIPSFVLTKVDSETKQPLAGVKFKITDINGTVVKDVNGNLLNNLVTDENGQIKVGLPKGIYYLVETNPLTGYENKEKIRIGIDEDLPAEKSGISSEIDTFGVENAVYPKKIVRLSESEYVVIGVLKSDYIIPADKTADGKEIRYIRKDTNKTTYRPYLELYNEQNKVKSLYVLSREYSNNITSMDLISYNSSSTSNYYLTIKYGSSSNPYCETIPIGKNGSSFYTGTELKLNYKYRAAEQDIYGGTMQANIFNVMKGDYGYYYVVAEMINLYELSIPAEYTESGQDLVFAKNIYQDLRSPMLVLLKYNYNNKVMEARPICILNKNADVMSMEQTADGGMYILTSAAKGYIVPNNMVSGTGYKLPDSECGILIKLTREGKTDWVKALSKQGNCGVTVNNATALNSGRILVGITFGTSYSTSAGIKIITYDSKETSNTIEITRCSGVLLQFNLDGTLLSNQLFQGNDESISGYNQYEETFIGCKTLDSGCIVIERNVNNAKTYEISSSDTVSGKSITLNFNNENNKRTLKIKYNVYGKIEWVAEGSNNNVLICQNTGSSLIEIEQYGNDTTIDTIRDGSKQVKSSDLMMSESDIVSGKVKEMDTKIQDYTQNGQIYNIIKNADGGYDLYVKLTAMTISADKTANNKDIVLESGTYHIKYNSENKVEYVEKITRNNTNVYLKVNTKDGGYLIKDTLSKDIVYSVDETVSGEVITLKKDSAMSQFYFTKYNKDEKVEWAKDVKYTGTIYFNNDGIQTSDNGYLLVGMLNSKDINISGEYITNGNTFSKTFDNSYNAIVLKLNKEGTLEWINCFSNNYSDSFTNCVDDGTGYIVSGTIRNDSLTIPAEDTENNKEIVLNRPSDITNTNANLILKYSYSGKIKWAQCIYNENSSNANVYSLENGATLVTTSGTKKVVIPAEATVSGEKIEFASKYTTRAIKAKLNKDGKVEWAVSLGQTINCIQATPDGGFLECDSKITESPVILKNGKKYALSGASNYILKYDSDGNIEYISERAANNNFNASKIVRLDNGKYIIVGTSVTNNKTLKLISLDEIISDEAKTPVKELVVENTKKKFKIMTDVTEYDVTNSDGTIEHIKGGSISGEDEAPYEYVTYDEDSTKEIKIIPDEGYKISEITSNYTKISFTPDENGVVVLDKFKNVITDKTIRAKFVKTTNSLKIKKIDKDTKQPIEGTSFYVKQLDERTSDDVLSGLVKCGDYGFTYSNNKYTPSNLSIGNSVADSYIKVDLTDKVGKFTLSASGSISASSGSVGYAYISSTTTPISQSSVTNEVFSTIGFYNTVGKVTLYGGYKYYLHLGFSKGDTDGKKDSFIINNVSVKPDSSDYYKGGTIITDKDGMAYLNNANIGKYEIKESYPSAGYMIEKDESGNDIKYYQEVKDGEDSTIVIENQKLPDLTIKKVDSKTQKPLAGAKFLIERTFSNSEDVTKYIPMEFVKNGEYYFEENENGELVSNNKEKGTKAVSYCKIDLSKFTGNYYIYFDAKVEGNISSDKYVFYRATSPSSSYWTSTVKEFGNIQDSTILYGGNVYYMILAYENNGGEDNYLKVNSINIKAYISNANEQNILKTKASVISTTDENGEILVNNVLGTVKATEIEAPDGYILNSETKDITLTVGENKELNFENTPRIKVTVHHYIKDTETSVADDDISYYDIGVEYTTSPHTDLDKYRLIKDENDNYVIPDNASGTTTSEDEVITYYYERIPGSVIVHHYLDGTEDKVVPDEFYEGLPESDYTTSPAKAPELQEKYEVVASKLPENASGKYSEDVTVVTYYYRVKDSKVIVHHVDVDTNDNIVDDVIINGKYDDPYTTSESKKIPGYYSYVRKTDNWEGNMGENTIEVTYYYQKNAVYIEPKIDKSSTLNELKDRNTAIPYIIKYEALIKNYDGDVNVVIVDKLPYKIDVNSSNINGAIYDESSMTLTWNEIIPNINTYDTENNEYTLKLTKIINLLFVDVDEMGDIIHNDVSAKITLGNVSKNISDEADIVNNLPGHVIVKYVDKYTNEEITDQTKHDGEVGTDFDISNDKKNIDGYTLVEEPAEKTGTYVKGNIEKTYYYAKNAILRIVYIDKLNNQKLVEDEIVNGIENEPYTTSSKNFEGYKVSDKDLPENANGILKVTKNSDGTYNRETVVNYYYIHEAKVVEKHIDIITNNVLSSNVTSGYEEDDYEINSKVFEGYELVKTHNGENKYPTNAKGKMTRSTIEVVYYYIRPAKVITKHIDKATGNEISDSVTIKGYQDDTYTTSSKNIENYVLVETPDNSTGKMTVSVADDGTVTDTTVVTYVYSHISSGVVEKHVDIETGEILYNEVHNGNEGDKYDIKSKAYDPDDDSTAKFKGFELVENDRDGINRLPDNNKGIMTIDSITVTYYYRRPAKLRVEYIDLFTNEKLATDFVDTSKYQNDKYIAEKKNFNNYKFHSEVIFEPGNNGEPTHKLLVQVLADKVNDETVVKYYYVQKSKVIENHIDIISGNTIYSKTHNGYEGDPYDISSKQYDPDDEETADFEGYDLVEEFEDEDGNIVNKLPANAKGDMTKSDITVNYYYIKKTLVSVKYIDIMTDKEIIKNVDIQGHEGDSYNVDEKDIEGYELVKLDKNGDNKYPENTQGNMTKDVIEVKFYYIKKTAVISRYYDMYTKQELAEQVVKKGLEGDEYTTEEKKFDSYVITKGFYPENAKGKMTANTIYVDYYYVRPVTVRVEYVDNLTGEKLSDDIILNGYEGDDYKTDLKNFDGYNLDNSPENAEGKMIVTKNSDGSYNTEIVVVYKYNKEVKQIVKDFIRSTKTGDYILVYFTTFILGICGVAVSCKKIK